MVSFPGGMLGLSRRIRGWGGQKRTSVQTLWLEIAQSLLVYRSAQNRHCLHVFCLRERVSGLVVLGARSAGGSGPAPVVP